MKHDEGCERIMSSCPTTPSMKTAVLKRNSAAIIAHNNHASTLEGLDGGFKIQDFIHNLHSVNNCFGRGDIYTM